MNFFRIGGGGVHYFPILPHRLFLETLITHLNEFYIENSQVVEYFKCMVLIVCPTDCKSLYIKFHNYSLYIKDL